MPTVRDYYPAMLGYRMLGHLINKREAFELETYLHSCLCVLRERVCVCMCTGEYEREGKGGGSMFANLGFTSSCLLIRARIPPQQLWPMTSIFSTCNKLTLGKNCYLLIKFVSKW